jgi:mannitol/fructose-specific phosphotransferase system IIA component (Ntr-type)
MPEIKRCQVWSDRGFDLELASFLDCLIILDESADVTRDQAIGVMLEGLASTGALPPEVVPDLQASIIRREELGPTGIGEGVAIPHAWHPSLERSVGALAVSRRGLDFESLDRMPVHIVVLLLTPAGAAGEQAKTAAFDIILRKMREGGFRRSVRQATTVDELSAIIRSAEVPGT